MLFDYFPVCNLLSRGQLFPVICLYFHTFFSIGFVCLPQFCFNEHLMYTVCFQQFADAMEETESPSSSNLVRKRYKFCSDSLLLNLVFKKQTGYDQVLNNDLNDYFICVF